MFPSGKGLWRFFARCGLLAILLAGMAAMATEPAPNDPAQLLMRADHIKGSNQAEFVALMQQLDATAGKLSPEQQLHFRYLKAWQTTYRGNYESAISQLNAIIAESKDTTLRFRAGATLVNLMGIGSHYTEAFAQLNPVLDQLPLVTDKEARIQGLSAAMQLYIEGGQYDLAVTYADKLLAEDQSPEGVCKANFYKLYALYGNGKLQTVDQRFQDSIDACVKAGELLYANGIRIFVAGVEIHRGELAAAINLLQKHYDEVQRTHYGRIISQFDASLAQAYWQQGDTALAEKFALDAVNTSFKGEYTEPLTAAYQLLYLIAKKNGDADGALAYHEKYMAADKGYLSSVSAKALAYETVNQQVIEKKLQIEKLNKQNQILKLQEALGNKAIETSRLYIVVLLMVLALIAFLAYRIKRSQLRFMKLSRRDGLTGIYNRQHFVSVAEQQLQSCMRLTHEASLVLIDLDHFKTVNDTHGHAVGDHVLRRTVAVCQSHLRSTDIFGRLGGEEFGILLPECNLEQIIERAEQIRQAIETASFDEETPGIVISASFGIAVTVRSGYQLRDLLVAADDALYRAKREGRNRVSISDSAEDLLKTA